MEILIFTFLQTIRFIFPIIVIIFIAFFISQILFEIGIFRKIEPIGKVLTKIANLPPIAIISFIASLGSALAGNSILQNLRENKKLTDKEVILCSLFNSSITPIRETFTFHLPVVLPTLGLIVGGFYIITLWLG
ncbi:MAG: nucleoside recognition protein, partial [Thermodesulfobacteriota bacterium]